MSFKIVLLPMANAIAQVVEVVLPDISSNYL